MAKYYQNNSGNVTVLGEETCFEGVLVFTDNLIVTGKFDGTIRSNGNLDIAGTAVCNVDSMSASSIVISGSVNGSVNAEKRLEMCSGSKIYGDVKTAKLKIAENVDFQGAVTMLDDVPEIDVFSVSGAEYKQQMTNNDSKKTEDSSNL